jgi:hypothetical protein
MQWLRESVDFCGGLADAGEGRKVENKAVDIGVGVLFLDGFLGKLESVIDSDDIDRLE